MIGYTIKYLFFLKKGYGKYYLEGLREGFHTLHKINKIPYNKGSFGNYLRIEWLLIKNLMFL